MFIFSQIRTYNDTADSTLPNVPRKRKFGDDEEDNTPHKTPRMDPVVKSEPEIGMYQYEYCKIPKFSDAKIFAVFYLHFN